jgi:hypothetical protein
VDGPIAGYLGSGNTVNLADGTVEPLKVPSGMQSGIELIVNFDVAPGTTKDVWIDFDAAHSIQVVMAGMSGQYLLRPTCWAFDKTATGSIHGTLTDAATTPVFTYSAAFTADASTGGVGAALPQWPPAAGATG